MNYEKTKEGSLKLINPPEIDYVNYWGGDKSTLQEQVYNVNGFINFAGVTKCQAIEAFILGKSVLEIGCAPAELLRYLKSKGYDTYGIAPETDPFIKSHSQSEIFTGTLNQFKTKRRFDNVIAMDVFEHIEDGDAFLAKCLSLTKKGGQIIFMLPILDHLSKPETMMHPEHIWLYSINHLKSMGFEWFAEWHDGHSIAIMKKP